MSIVNLLRDLRSRGIELELSDGRLVSRSAKGALSPELAASIRAQREEIIAFLREGLVERNLADVPAIVPVPRATYMPVSYSQERLWYLNQVDQNPAVYNLPLSFRVVGPMRVELLQRCLDEIETRHEALRTTVEMVDGQAMQRIHAPRGMRLAQVDLRPGRVSTGAPTLDALLQREAMGAFDLARGPLARATLIRTAEQEHYFLLLMHHVISDGLSTQIILRELVSLYESLGRGEPSPLEPLPIQFADYAVWQRSWLHGAALERQLQYWKEQLAAPLPVLDVPADFPRPPMRSANGAKVPLKLGKELVATLSRVARDEGATTFMALMALYVIFLHRESQQDDIIVGTPVANRTRRESADIVGFIANTVVLRHGLDGEPSFRDVVRRVRDVCVGAFRHQDMPFQKIVEVLNPPRDMSRTPIFQAFFTFHEISSQASHMGELELHPVVAGSNVSRMDLSLFLRELDTEILGSLEYNTDLYHRDTIVRLIGHFTTLAESAAANPEVPARRLRMLTDAEHLAFTALNATETDYPRVPLHDMIGAQLLVGADRIAVRCGSESLTYAQLDGRANRVAQRLRSAGIGRGDLVGICLDRTLDLPTALLGVLKCGAAYVPLDPAFPAPRIAYMLQDARARVVVSQRAIASRLPAGAHTVLCIEDLASGALAEHGVETDVTPDDRAYVIYTSGTTGLPKGVEVSGGNVVNFLSTMRECPGIRADDVLVAVTTPSFDIAVLELFLPLTVGASVVIAPTETVTNGRALAALLRTAGATIMQATPATWRLLVDAGWEGQPGLKALCGGEALPPALAERLLPLVGELWNMYGPTETTVWSTCARIMDARAPIRIGRPVGNTVVRVVDGAGQQLPAGVPGELLIGGAGVARGYLGRSELTARQFVTDPTGELSDTRFYRTGDVVKLHPDGTLEHLGRTDNQVKVQGYRIELGEIESVLTAHPAISEAVAGVHAGTDADARLVAWVIYAPGEQLTGSEVRRYLRNQLPAYMIPGVVVQLDAMPRTANGKVDRRALPDPLATECGSRKFVPPATEMERVIADAWGGLLPVTTVGRTDNFFELGGHSLLSMRAVAGIEERTGVRIDPRLFFFQTVQQLGVTLEQLMAAA